MGQEDAPVLYLSDWTPATQVGLVRPGRSIFILSRKAGQVSRLCMDTHRVNCYPVNCPIVSVVSEGRRQMAHERHRPVEATVTLFQTRPPSQSRGW